MWFNARITDLATSVIAQFCGTFLVWILAEELHLSGIVTTVVFAMAAARRASEVVPARIRIPTFAVWEVAVFVLNVLAFILVGFQLKSIAERISGPEVARSAGFTAAVLLTTILARIAWVTAAAWVSRWRCRPRPDGTPGPRDAVALSGRGATVVGWSGMRGTITLATALALPGDFPLRDLILTTAFGVTLGTLVIQGLTLRPLMLRLGLEDDGLVDREARLARAELMRSAVAAVGSEANRESAALVQRRYALQLIRAEAELQVDRAGDDGQVLQASALDDDYIDATLVRAATRAQRVRLMALRSDGTIGDSAFQRVEEQLDWTELGWAQVLGTERLNGGGP